jgi:NAD(P)-dependent dehydrogenase (short-subunit alcohol dehydrogenase family)
LSHIDSARRRVIVTGVGFRGQAEEQSAENVFTAAGAKPNIGAAIALRAAQTGYSVVIVAKTESKLELVRTSILETVPSADVLTWPSDLLDSVTIRRLAEGLPSERELDVVHCAGLSAGSYKLADDNPYLPVDKMPIELPTLEFDAVVKTLLVIVQAFLPRWRAQQSSKLVVVSSMSGIRAVPFAYSHVSAKAAIHQAVRGLALELNPEGIQVSEVLPGIVDTGMYDHESVQAAVDRIARSFGYEYKLGCLPQMSPHDVASAVMLCLTSGAHVLSVALVSAGQFPHHGA